MVMFGIDSPEGVGFGLPGDTGVWPACPNLERVRRDKSVRDQVSFGNPINTTGFDARHGFQAPWPPDW
ncbi:MAG: hypothetical protein ACRCYQ_01090 [Nocardioides sp.]